MLTIKNKTAVKSFNEFITNHRLKETVACVDDGKCQYKTTGYWVKDFFIHTYKNYLSIYVKSSEDKWVVI